MEKVGVAELIVLLMVIGVGLFLYFLPTFIAFSKQKSNKGIILLVNFFLGWSFIGWIVSLVWALSSDDSQTIIINENPSSKGDYDGTKKAFDYDEKLISLQKLKDLLDSGVLSEIEFEEQKTKILSS